MSVPTRIDDGDFTIPAQNGAATPSHPFADKGDTLTFIMSVPMRIDSRYYRPPVTMQQKEFELGAGYLVDIEPTSLVGAELYQYNEIYASIPLPREEYGAVLAQVGRFVDETTPFSLCDGLLLYEYSIYFPLPPLQAESFYVSGRTPGSGVGGRPVYYRPGGSWTRARRIIENSTSRIWMGRIYERLSKYANVPTFIPAA